MDLSRTIHEVLRASDIQRWSMVRMSRKQNLAEHSFNVTMIAMALAEELGVDPKEVAYYAITHDLDEIYTGDIPSHTKKEMRRLGLRTEALEGLITDDAPGMTWVIIKVADFLEALWYVEENGVGSHAKEVQSWVDAEFSTYLSALDKKLVDATMSIHLTMRKGTFNIVSPLWGEKK